MSRKKKECSKCFKIKNKSEFYTVSGNYKDNLHSYCKECDKIKSKLNKRKVEGLLSRIYSGQKNNSKRRGDLLPDYTLAELKYWAKSQLVFFIIYGAWVKSGYKKDLKPSFDRLDDYKPYTLGNIQIVTWEENRKKSYSDIKNGVNNKISKSVIGVHDKTGDIIRFHSLMEAERVTGINNSQISAVCRGIDMYKTAGGYNWSYT